MKLLRLFYNGKKTEAQFLDLSEKKDDIEIDKYYKSVELIEGEDVKDLLLYIMKKDDFELDEFEEDALDNPAQKLIYKELYTELTKVIDSKKDIIAQVDEEFKDAENKYSIENN